MAISVANAGVDRVVRQSTINAFLATAAAGPTALLAADAEYCNDLMSITIINNVVTAQTVTVSDGGSTAFIVPLPSAVGGSVTINFAPGVWKQAAKNTAWNITQTATATDIFAVFRKTAP